MSKQSSFGVCAFCGVRKSKAAMAAHLKQCVPAHAKGKPGKPVMLLRAQDGPGSVFWLHVAAPFGARLEQLDGLLRDVWLECCGHMSAFCAGRYNELPMRSRMTEVFGAVGDKVLYEYDFGSTTGLVLTLAGITAGTSAGPIVAARNEAPVWPCSICEQPAIHVCGECLWRGAGYCCPEHAQVHECGEEMLLPVVNSPRMGVCGYTGL